MSALVVDHKLVASVLDTTDAAIWVQNRRGRVIFANRALEEITGYRRVELIGQPLPPGLGIDEETKVELVDIPTGEEVSTRGHGFWECRDGSRRWMSWSVRELHAPADGTQYRIVTAIDATAQRLDRETLDAERDFISAVLWTVPALVAVADPEGRVMRFNQAFADATGLRFEDVEGKAIWDLVFAPEHVAEAKRVFRELCDSGVPMSAAAHLHDRGGHVRQIAWHGSVMRDAEGRVQFALAAGIDVTAERAAARELRQAHERLRDLSKAMERVREEERRRIARELHDELGQSLAGLRMDLESLVRDVPPRCMTRPPPGCEGMVQRLTAMQSDVDRTVQSVRRIAAELRPLVLDDLGLAAAVEWLVEGFAQRSGIKCRLRVADRCANAPEPYATTLFRILQESLTNIAKHARARQVGIDVSCDDGQMIVLRISDDGVGIAQDATGKPNTFGLMGMRERANALGGELAIESAPGRGTTITVRLPAASADSPER